MKFERQGKKAEQKSVSVSVTWSRTPEAHHSSFHLSLSLFLFHTRCNYELMTALMTLSPLSFFCSFYNPVLGKIIVICLQKPAASLSLCFPCPSPRWYIQTCESHGSQNKGRNCLWSEQGNVPICLRTSFSFNRQSNCRDRTPSLLPGKEKGSPSGWDSQAGKEEEEWRREKSFLSFSRRGSPSPSRSSRFPVSSPPLTRKVVSNKFRMEKRERGENFYTCFVSAASKCQLLSTVFIFFWNQNK